MATGAAQMIGAAEAVLAMAMPNAAAVSCLNNGTRMYSKRVCHRAKPVPLNTISIFNTLKLKDFTSRKFFRQATVESGMLSYERGCFWRRLTASLDQNRTGGRRWYVA